MLRFRFAVNGLLTVGFLAVFLAGDSVAQDTLKVGDAAPDFEVATLGEKTVKLSDRFGDDGTTTVLLFSRANW